MDFENFRKSNFVRGKLLKIRSSINLPWGQTKFHKKFGPDRFSRLLDTNKQTNKLNLYIDKRRVNENSLLIQGVPFKNEIFMTTETL